MICDVSADALPPLDDAGLDGRTACPVDEAMRQMQRAAAGSCGRDVFCREGTRQVMTILADLAAGKGESSDLELIDELCSLIAANASCGMAATFAGRALDLLRGSTEEWELHLRRKRCTSLTCAMSFTVYIAPDACNGCGECYPVCPEAAITGSESLIHVVLTDTCTNCLACLPVCPTTAIRKAGPIKPRIPASPVPVGSFKAGGDAGSMTKRRRRSS